MAAFQGLQQQGWEVEGLGQIIGILIMMMKGCLPYSISCCLLLIETNRTFIVPVHLKMPF